MTTGLDSIDYFVTADVFVSDTHTGNGGVPDDESENTITYDYMSSRPAMMMEQMVRLRGIAATPLTTEELQFLQLEIADDQIPGIDELRSIYFLDTQPAKRLKGQPKPNLANGTRSPLHLYVCVAPVSHLHPHFDAVVEGILSRDKLALIVFAQPQTLTHRIETEQQHEYGLDIYSEAKRRLLYDVRLDHVNQRRLPSAWQERIWRRWHKSRRIRFLTGLPRIHYIGLVRAAAAVLDPFPVSPPGATIEALAMGVPVVTMAPGSSQVPSMSTTHGMYRMMGLHKVTALPHYCIPTTHHAAVLN
jgi:hypothetical protein